jgi:hypothetical protein
LGFYFCSSSTQSSFAAALFDIFDSLEASFSMLLFGCECFGISAAQEFAYFVYYCFRFIDVSECFA